MTWLPVPPSQSMEGRDAETEAVHAADQAVADDAFRGWGECPVHRAGAWHRAEHGAGVPEPGGCGWDCLAPGRRRGLAQRHQALQHLNASLRDDVQQFGPERVRESGRYHVIRRLGALRSRLLRLSAPGPPGSCRILDAIQDSASVPGRSIRNFMTLTSRIVCQVVFLAMRQQQSDKIAAGPPILAPGWMASKFPDVFPLIRPFSPNSVMRLFGAGDANEQRLSGAVTGGGNAPYLAGAAMVSVHAAGGRVCIRPTELVIPHRGGRLGVSFNRSIPTDGRRY